MGMFDWGAKRKAASRKADRVTLLRTAAMSIREDLPDLTPVSIGSVAGKLATVVRVAADRPLVEDQSVMAGGLLCISAGRGLTVMVEENNDGAKEVAFFAYLKGDQARFKKAWPVVKAEYERLSSESHALIEGYNKGLIAWACEPAPEKIDDLAKLFGMYCAAIEGVAFFQERASRFQAGVTGLGYTKTIEKTGMSVASAAGFLVRALTEDTNPDRTDEWYDIRRGLFAMSVGSYLAKIYRIPGGGTENLALIEVEQNRAQDPGDRKRFFERVMALYKQTNPSNDEVMGMIVKLLDGWLETGKSEDYERLAEFFSLYIRSHDD